LTIRFKVLKHLPVWTLDDTLEWYMRFC
jgi:hypothetical protein